MYSSCNTDTTLKNITNIMHNNTTKERRKKKKKKKKVIHIQYRFRNEDKYLFEIHFFRVIIILQYYYNYNNIHRKKIITYINISIWNIYMMLHIFFFHISIIMSIFMIISIICWWLKLYYWCDILTKDLCYGYWCVSANVEFLKHCI